MVYLARDAESHCDSTAGCTADPSNGPDSRPSPRREGNPELLRLCLLVLEKAHLMHTDIRAEGFRWYVTIPWHALAIAMAEMLYEQRLGPSAARLAVGRDVIPAARGNSGRLPVLWLSS